MYLTNIEIIKEHDQIQFDFCSLDMTIGTTMYINTPLNYRPLKHLGGLWLVHRDNQDMKPEFEKDIDFTYGDTRVECYKKIFQLKPQTKGRK